MVGQIGIDATAPRQDDEKEERSGAVTFPQVQTDANPDLQGVRQQKRGYSKPKGNKKVETYQEEI